MPVLLVLIEGRPLVAQPVERPIALGDDRPRRAPRARAARAPRARRAAGGARARAAAARAAPRTAAPLVLPFEPFAGAHLHYSCDSSRQQSRRARAQAAQAPRREREGAPDAAASARVLAAELPRVMPGRLDADERPTGAAPPRRVMSRNRGKLMKRRSRQRVSYSFPTSPRERALSAPSSSRAPRARTCRAPCWARHLACTH